MLFYLRTNLSGKIFIAHVNTAQIATGLKMVGDTGAQKRDMQGGISETLKYVISQT